MKNTLCAFAIIVSLIPIDTLSAQELSKKEKKLVGTWIFEFAMLDWDDGSGPHREDFFHYDSITFQKSGSYQVNTKNKQFRKGNWKISADSICFSNIVIVPEPESPVSDYCIKLKKLNKKALVFLFPVSMVIQVDPFDSKTKKIEQPQRIHFRRKK